MEPALDDHVGLQRLSLHDPAGAPPITLAECGDHGLPIRWDSAYSPAA
jgi:hypothetical protein